jgi:hypothetical protein
MKNRNMKQLIHLKSAVIAWVRGPIRCQLLTRVFLLVPLLFACFAFSPAARAVCREGCDLNNGNTFLGGDALNSNSTGVANTAVGGQALFNNTDGSANTAVGDAALFHNTASYNTAIGSGSLYYNTGGFYNTAVGIDALEFNIAGGSNTAIGADALRSNTSGGGNTANGANALSNNRDAGNNTATGFNALYNNNTGSSQTATGAYALYHNTSGAGNTATGGGALNNNTMGNYNTASGLNALYHNTSGAGNTATGGGALNNNTMGYYNIALGLNAGFNLTTGSNNIDIGNAGVAGESNKIRIGTQGTQNGTFIAGIYNVAVTGSTVAVNSSGKLGVTASSARFKEAIKPLDKASEAILALKPVTFRYKKEIDEAGIPQFGLVAEEVEKVDPDLVSRDAGGKAYTVRYEAVNAMLLNEFLKEHRTVQEMKKEIAVLTATVKEQALQIQKVSAQIELNKPAPRTALNNQ